MNSRDLIPPVVASGVELALFHGWDTVAKRLQTNPIPSGNFFTWKHHRAVMNAIFPNATTTYARFASAYVGLPEACLYRVAQRVTLFGGQPLVSPWVHRHTGEWLKSRLGHHLARPTEEAIAGCLVSLPEATLHPLDTMKVMRQTEVPSDQIQSAMRHNRYLFSRGFKSAALRKSTGAFALFFSSACIKEQLFELADFDQATTTQEYIANSLGATIATIANNPLDVVKTAHQQSGCRTPSMQLARSIWRAEGMLGFTRGLGIRLLSTAPRVAVAMSITAEIRKELSR